VVDQQGSDMHEHPIRLILEDDLERTRLTVLVRALLVIPHFIWLAFWGIGVLFAVIANWFATLVRGSSPAGLHRFLASYVKYVTQVYGYLYLAANPYPSFDGSDGYPIDLVIAGPERQSRWRVALRAILIAPAALFALTLVGLPSASYRTSDVRGSTHSSGFSTRLDLLLLVAVLGWFAVLARGRMPRGLRDTAAYCISYAAQLWGYVFLLTDRYPNSDPLVALPELPVRDDPAQLEVQDELSRSRLTVFFRLLLTIPHFVWLALWGILALLAAILNWFAVLITGRVPGVLGRFLSAYLRYQFHVYGFLYLVANPFPGFTGQVGSYPLEVVLREPAPQRRWTVLLRIVLALPALLLAASYSTVAGVAAVLGWFAALATGRMPRGLRNAAALALRYQLQTTAYLFVLYEAYPYSGPSRSGGSAVEPPAASEAAAAFG
jgi:hypothetical protein